MTEKKNKKAVTPKTTTSKKVSSKIKQPSKVASRAIKASSKKIVRVNKTSTIASLKKDEKVIVPVNALKKDKTPSYRFLSFMYDFAQALVIASLILLLTISFFVVGQQKKSDNGLSNNKDYFGALEDVKIVKKGKDFFGGLMFQQADNSARQVAGMGGLAETSSSDASFGNAIDSKMIVAPYPNQKFNYVYTGADFELFPSEVEVFKRIDPDFSGELNSSLRGKKIAFLDVDKLKNINVSNLTINEDREYGYTIYLGLKDGSFSLYKNWDKWPSLDKLCGGYDQACYDSKRFKIEDVLGDEEVVNITNSFLQEYNINLEGYGAPEVQKYWMRDYEMSSEKSSYYISDTINVVYPLKINGATVYSDYGQKVGINVEVDMREKKVSGLYNMYYQYYESSNYTSEVDKDLVLKTAQQGGMYPDYYYMGDSEETKKIDIELDTPILGLIKTWQYDQTTMKGYELHVPAYIFPIKSKPEGVYFSRDNIVVPAVKDFFVNYNTGVRPMLMEASESTTTSEGDITTIEPAMIR